MSARIDPLPVSVVVPAYNRAALLPTALASVFAQLPRPAAEVIVVDDGSGDATGAVAESMGARLIRHWRNQGLSAARNTGLRAARHSWVALLDSDDEWLPHHLATLWPLRRGQLLVSSSALACGADPAADRFAGPIERKPVVLRSADQLIFPSNIIPVSAAMLRRETALELGGFRPHHGVVEDLDMWLRLLERGTAVCSPRVSVIYRVHPEQMSARDPRTMQLGHAAAAEAHIQRTRGSRVALERSNGVAAWDNVRRALSQGERRVALRWGAHLASRPQRLIGLAGILIRRYRVRRRSGALRRAGVGRATPSGRETLLDASS